MKLSSMLAIYILFWALCLFLVLPFRLRTSDEPDVAVPGEAYGAPPRFSVGRTALWTTVVATTAFALFCLNYIYGWLPVDALNFFPEPTRL